MFGKANKLLIRILLRENSRLRKDLREEKRTTLELLDRFVSNKVPERLMNRSISGISAGDKAVHLPQFPSDAYSVAIEEAERKIDAMYPNGYEYEEIIEDDD